MTHILAQRLSLEDGCSLHVSFSEADVLLELFQEEGHERPPRLVQAATLTSTKGLDLALLALGALIVMPTRNRWQWLDRLRGTVSHLQGHLQRIEARTAPTPALRAKTRGAPPGKRAKSPRSGSGR